MVNRELVQGFRSWLDKSGHTTSDSGWSPNLIYYYMCKYRAALVKIKLDSGQDINYENYKILPCVKLIRASRNECPCAPQPGCSFVKTVIPVPRMIKILSVSSILGEIKYDYIQWDRFEDKLNHRIGAIAKEPYYTYKTINDNTHLYLYNTDHKKHVTITMIPYDPIEVALFPDCNGVSNECLDAFDVKFPIDPDDEIPMYEWALKSLISPRQGVETDQFSDSKEDDKTVPMK